MQDTTRTLHTYHSYHTLPTPSTAATTHKKAKNIPSSSHCSLCRRVGVPWAEENPSGVHVHRIRVEQQQHALPTYCCTPNAFKPPKPRDPEDLSSLQYLRVRPAKQTSPSSIFRNFKLCKVSSFWRPSTLNSQKKSRKFNFLEEITGDVSAILSCGEE